MAITIYCNYISNIMATFQEPMESSTSSELEEAQPDDITGTKKACHVNCKYLIVIFYLNG